MSADHRPILARTPADLGTAWAQRVVAAAAPGATVRGVAVRDVSAGTTTRVRLEVAHDGPLPARWFVKLPARAWRARAITSLAGLGRHEVRFYRALGGSLPVEHPVALAGTSRGGGAFTLVLVDLAERGAVAANASDPLSAERAGAVVSLLAALHAPLWEHPRLDRDLAWLGGPVRRLEDALGSVLAVALMRRGLARAAHVVPTRLRRPALEYARCRRRVMRRLGAGPRTLVHHDCHPGNLYWRGTAPGLLDWQLARIGDGVGDVAYLLATGLEPPVRRAVEGALLARYAAALAECGVKVTRLEGRYRAHSARVFEAMVVTAGIGGLMPEAAGLEMVRRTAAAVDDLDGFAACGL